MNRKVYSQRYHGGYQGHHQQREITLHVPIPTELPNFEPYDMQAKLNEYVVSFSPNMTTTSHNAPLTTHNIQIMCMPNIYELDLQLRNIQRADINDPNWHGAYRRALVVHQTVNKYHKHSSYYAMADAIGTTKQDIPLHTALSIMRMLKTWDVKNISSVNHNMDIAARLFGCGYESAVKSTVTKIMPNTFKARPIDDPNDIHLVFADKYDASTQPGYGRWYVTREPFTAPGYVLHAKLTYYYGLFAEHVGELFIASRLPPDGYDLNKVYDIPLRVQTYNISRNRKIHVVDESWLVGGDKQRILHVVLKDVKQKEVFYRGPVNGYTQVGLAYACLLMGKNFHMIVNKQKYDRHQLTYLAALLGANIHEIPKPQNPEEEEKFVNEIINSVKDPYVVPHGLAYENTEEIFAQSEVRKIADLNIKTMWIVASSGTIYNSLRAILPKEAKFKVVVVNNKPLAKVGVNTDTFIHPLPFHAPAPADVRPPFPAEATYDAKMWSYILDSAENGDFAFNIAGI